MLFMNFFQDLLYLSEIDETCTIYVACMLKQNVRNGISMKFWNNIFLRTVLRLNFNLHLYYSISVFMKAVYRRNKGLRRCPLQNIMDSGRDNSLLRQFVVELSTLFNDGAREYLVQWNRKGFEGEDS